jgi:hypothetical protein
MSDPEKLNNDVESHSFDPTDSNTSKKSESQGIVGFKEKIVGKITGATDNKMEVNDVSLSESIRISNNIRMILLGLFALIGFIVLASVSNWPRSPPVYLWQLLLLQSLEHLRCLG